MNEPPSVPAAAPFDRFLTIRLLPLYICIAAFLVRFVCIICCEYHLCSDAAEFWKIARNIIAGKGFLLNGLPTAYRMPGFPGVLALFGFASDNMVWLRSVLALCEVATGVFIYLLGKEHFGRKPAIVAFAVWSLLPISVVQPLLFLSEGLFTALFMALLLVVIRPASLRTTVIGGLLCGLLILVKQHMLLFPAVFAAVLLVRREQPGVVLKHLFIFSVIAAVTVVPWAIRNKHHFGAYTLSTNGGQNLYIGNNPSATGSYYNLPPEMYPPVGKEMESDGVLKKQAVSYIIHNPVAVMKTVPKKIAFLFSLESASVILLHFKGCMPGGVSYRDAFRQTPLWSHVLFSLPYIIIVLAAVWAMWLLSGQSLLLKSIIVIMLFWTGIHALYFGASRFHYPLLPLMALAASAFFERFPIIFTRGRTIGALVVSCGFISVWGAELLMAYR